MSDDLRRKLRMLEGDYFGQPLVARRADIQDINQLRALLKMPLVDDHLNLIGVAAVERARAPEPEVVPDHVEAREIYRAFLTKHAELERHRAYAERVARATTGNGPTPVRPLATMGTGGGPLLCDHCGKPIVLEGGQFQGVPADVAWQSNPAEKWASWISGGMVVEVQTNGTLRIYHGYPGRNDKQCCNAARRADEAARAAFKSRKCVEKYHLLLAFLEHDFPAATRQENHDRLNTILDTMYSYDPGSGVNRPGDDA